MRRVVYALFAVAMPLSSIAWSGPARAAEPQSASCSATAVASVNGVHAPSAPKCSLPVLTCPADSAGCVFSARMSMSATTGVGASRGLLRIKDAQSGVTSDFYCGGPATRCHTIQPTAFLPAGTSFLVTCAATKDNVLVNPKVNCAAAFAPLGSE